MCKVLRTAPNRARAPGATCNWVQSAFQSQQEPAGGDSGNTILFVYRRLGMQAEGGLDDGPEHRGWTPLSPESIAWSFEGHFALASL